MQKIIIVLSFILVIAQSKAIAEVKCGPMPKSIPAPGCEWVCEGGTWKLKCNPWLSLGAKEKAYGEYYRNFVLSSVRRGEKVTVPAKNLRYLEGHVEIEGPSMQTLAIPSSGVIYPKDADLTKEILAVSSQLADPSGHRQLEQFARTASYEEKTRFLETDESFDLSSTKSKISALGEDKKEKEEKEKKECRQACDTVCSCLKKKVCEWVCEDAGLGKTLCKNKCYTICEEKCKEVCHKVCE